MEELRWETTIKILGIEFNKNLNFKEHTINLRKKILRQIGAIKYIASSQRGVRMNHMIKIVNATIRSRLEYGYTVLSSAPISTLNNLEIMYNGAMRAALSLPRQTPIPLLRKEMNSLPIIDRLNMLAQKFFIKHSALREKSVLFEIIESSPYKKAPKRQQKWTLTYKFRNIFQTMNIYKSQLIPYTVIDYTITRNIEVKTTNLLFQTAIADCDKQKYFKEMMETEWSSSMIIATDGSKSTDYTSVAIWNKTLKEKIAGRIPQENTIFTTESLGIWIAINRWMHINTDKVILTDSMSVLKALEHPNEKSPFIIKRILKDCESNKSTKITFIWIPSHVGIEENEIADKLAKEARNSNLILNWIAPEDVLKQVTIQYTSKFQVDFTRTKYSANFNYLQQSNPKCRNFLKNRKEEVILARARTRTLPTRRFLYKCKLVDSPLCLTCGVVDTVDHIVLSCIKYEDLRCRLRKSCGCIPLSFEWLVVDDYSNKGKTRALVKFLIAAGFG